MAFPPEVLNSAANDSIGYETTKASAPSAAAGMPGFVALPATVRADPAQYADRLPSSWRILTQRNGSLCVAGSEAIARVVTTLKTLSDA
ncbi:hypothetical protein ABID95_004374 [Streptomyces atratus]